VHHSTGASPRNETRMSTAVMALNFYAHQGTQRQPDTLCVMVAEVNVASIEELSYVQLDFRPDTIRAIENRLSMMYDQYNVHDSFVVVSNNSMLLQHYLKGELQFAGLKLESRVVNMDAFIELLEALPLKEDTLESGTAGRSRCRRTIQAYQLYPFFEQSVRAHGHSSVEVPLMVGRG
jgi:hypothetical protein